MTSRSRASCRPSHRAWNGSPGKPVHVTTTLGTQGKAAGTGIVLTASGEVLTNHHVVQGATSIQVDDLGDGRSYVATVVGYDAAHDIAVLQLKGAANLPTVALGDSN